MAKCEETYSTLVHLIDIYTTLGIGEFFFLRHFYGKVKEVIWRLPNDF